VTGNKPTISDAYQYLGEIYMQEKNYNEAINYLNKALAIINTIDEKTSLSSLYNDLAISHKTTKDFQSAYAYASLDNSLKDSILKTESVKKTTEMGALFNSDKKDKEIALLTKDQKIKELEIKKQSSLMYSFIAGFALMCILFFFVYRNYRIRQKLNLQQLRNKIAIDLHDEVGSTLSSIKIFSEIARRHSKELTPTLDQIIEYSHKMIESMADIVWSINPENDNFENIIVRMRSFAYELLGAKKIDFQFEADDSLANLKLPMDVRKNLYLIFKEAINNMTKYSQANRALFSISNENNELAMLIRDNGKGFDINQHTQGNGLKNMKKRASEIGAKIFIESESGNGTTIQLLISTAI
jgi:signal transduction histidine kinase